MRAWLCSCFVRRFKSSVSQFMTVIYSMEYEKGTTEKTTEKNSGRLNGGLNESQIVTLEYICQHEGCQVKQISADMNVPIDTIDKHISVLLKKSLIERRGSKRTGGYYPL